MKRFVKKNVLKLFHVNANFPSDVSIAATFFDIRFMAFREILTATVVGSPWLIASVNPDGDWQ